MKPYPLLPAFAAFFLALHPLAAAPAFGDLNTALGYPLFADDNLWDDDVTATATRVGWPAESSAGGQSSHRLYTREDAKALGAHPYSLALYGTAGKPTRVTIMFANQGDFGNFFQLAQNMLRARGAQKSILERQARETLRDFPKALDAEAKAISDTLTTALGNPVPVRTSFSGSAQEKVTRWDWQGHAFLLSKLDNGFVAVQIVPAASLDETEAATRQRDAVLKEKLRSQLQHRPNGDVVIGELPMIDQGPKGFCVPATLARYASYLGIASDMYVLAIKAQTGMGGGTGATGAFSAASDLARAHGRRFEKVPAGLRLNAVAQSIDAGLPIMWGLDAREDLERDISDRSQQRKTMTDPAQWKAVLKNVKKPKKLRDVEPLGHMCLIIGYNKQTGEIAISDSWGPEFAERWITPDELEAMNLNEAAVISF